MDRHHYRTSLSRAVAPIVLFFGIAIVSNGWAQVPDELVSYPDWIFTNGKILTVDKNFSIVEALAAREGRILATGANASIERLAGPKTRHVDLQGKTMIPGIIDPHVHLQDAALNQFGADVAAKEPKYRDYFNMARVEGESVEEILQNIKRVVASRKPGTWVRVRLKDGETMGPLFYDKVRRGDLDKVAPNNPLVVQPYSIISTINTKVIEQIKAFYGYLPEDFEKDGTGQLSGRVDTVLMRSVVGDLLIDHPQESLPPAFKKELQKYAGYGVTTWSSAISPLSFLSVFRQMERQGDLPIRTALTQSVGIAVFPYAPDFYKRLGDVTNMGTDWFWIIGVGVTTTDGSFELACVTMKVLPNALNAPQGPHPCFVAPGTLRRRALFEAIKAGNSLTGTHNSGDLAADQLMDTIEEASAAAGMTPDQIRAKSHSIDHCNSYPRPDQIERGKKLNILWNCGADFIETDAADGANWYGDTFANTRMEPIASILKAGGRVTGQGEGVRGDSYFANLEMFLTRRDSKGRVWGKQEAIDRKDLLRMYTNWSAEYVKRQDRLGSLEPRKFADLVVLDKDYMTLPIDQFHTIHALMTMVGGKVVFQNPSFTMPQQ
jgi:predicted amidohydrolase YtcJ